MKEKLRRGVLSMGKASIKKNKNIYQLTREELGLSRAAAVTRIPDNPEFPDL